MRHENLSVKQIFSIFIKNALLIFIVQDFPTFLLGHVIVRGVVLKKRCGNAPSGWVCKEQKYTSSSQVGVKQCGNAVGKRSFTTTLLSVCIVSSDG